MSKRDATATSEATGAQGRAGAGVLFRDLLLLPLAASAAFAWTLESADAQSGAESAETEEKTVTRTLNPIDWPRVQTQALEAGVEGVGPGGGLARFEGSSGRSADNLQIPVLLPSSLIAAHEEDRLDQPMELLARTNDYSAEAKLAPRSYLIQGTRFVFEAPEGAAEPAPQVQAAEVEDPISIEQNEYGIAASFERYGAIYTIEIFCALPSADVECNEETRVRELVAEMTFVP